MKCAHEWSIVLGLRSFPNGKGGVNEYIGKCKKCGECVELKPEIVQLIFKNGGPNEDR